MLNSDKFIRSKCYGKCANCNKYNTSPAWCYTCDPQKIVQGWSSGNKDVDDCIKELQLNATSYINVIEWIPSSRLDNFRKIGGGRVLATWLDGTRTCSYDEEGIHIQSRTPPCTVNIKILSCPQNSMDILNDFKNHVQLSEGKRIYGLTHNTISNEYMLVFDEFDSKRVVLNGKCAKCCRYNTSPAWCQTCDPQRTTQGWTSGNKDVDNYIRKFQLNAIKSEEVIEWIPFNRFRNIKKVGKNFSAIWLDGIRITLGGFGRYTQSRIKSYKVKLKILTSSQNLSDILKFIDHIQLRNSNLKVYGLTKKKTTNKYMLVFDGFGSKRDKKNGKCANCNRFNTSKAWCKTCDLKETIRGWTSKDKKVDDCIKKFQLNATDYENVIEWIPFNRLDNIHNIQKNDNGFSAIWLDGIRIASCKSDEYDKYDESIRKYTQSRSRSYKVELKTLVGSQNSMDFLNEFKGLMQLNNNELKVYGLTRNTETKEYMSVFDKFSSKRDEKNGRCLYCKQYNTSPAWCQTCDPHIAVQRWTSGNKDIDDCIKELQLKATSYDNMIEWIPFDRLIGIQEIGDRILATWLDGVRSIQEIHDGYEKYTRLRTSQCRITLQTLLAGSQNLLDILREFKSYVQLESEPYKSATKIYGLTQNTATNEYMLVFDYFGSKRDKKHGKCANCNQYNTSEAWCQTCDPHRTTQGWTSGNNDIDDCIKNFQLSVTNYEKIIEWIPFNKFDNIQKIGGRILATWLDGVRHVDEHKDEHIQSRISSSKVELKILTSSQSLSDILREFIDQIQLKKYEWGIYGLTQNTTTNEYMLVFDEFDSKRYKDNGNCTNCNRYNTDFVWCRICDPYKTTQGWTSGNNDVDNCIKELQLDTMEYTDVIEWIPFNRLENIQQVGEEFLATWLDGIRSISYDNDSKPTQSRTPSYKVELKVLHGSQNSLYFLSEFKDLKDKLKVYGLTRDTVTNEYMLVFDKFGSKRHINNGKCAICSRYKTSNAWCQTCDPQKITQGWTSGNKDVDYCIKEFQLNATEYENVIEWIPFNRLDNIQQNVGGFLATWLDGERKVFLTYEETENKLKNIQSRTSPRIVMLKILDLSDFKAQLKNRKIYGLTRDTAKNEYMLVFDFIRNDMGNGECADCNRYNTSPAWCQTCDP